MALQSITALGAHVADVLLNARTLADAAATPRRHALTLVLAQPALAALAGLAAYVAWLPLAGLCALLSLALSPYGTVAALAALAVWAGRLIASGIVFPPSIAVVAKSMEREVAAKARDKLLRHCAQLEAHAVALAVTAAALQPPTPSLPSLQLPQAAPLSNTAAAAAAAFEALQRPVLDVWAAQQRELDENLREEELGRVSRLAAAVPVVASPMVAGSLPPLLAAPPLAHASVLRHYLQLGAALLEAHANSRVQPATTAEVPASLALSESPPALAVLARAAPHALVFAARPPYVPAADTAAALAAVKCAVDTLALAPADALALALACLTRARSLTVWAEVVPHSGLGGGASLVEVAASLTVAAADDQAQKDTQNMVVEAEIARASWRLWSLLFAAIRRAFLASVHLHGGIAATMAEGAAGMEAATAADSTQLSSAELVAVRCGLQAGALARARARIEAAAAGPTLVSPLPAPTPASPPPQTVGPGARYAQLSEDGTMRSPPVQGSTSAPSSSSLASSPWQALQRLGLNGVPRRVARAAAVVRNAVWRFLTSAHTPEPACGLSFFRCEAALVAGGRQLWVRAPDGGYVDCMLFPCAAAIASEATSTASAASGGSSPAASVAGSRDRPAALLPGQQQRRRTLGIVPSSSASASSSALRRASASASSSALSGCVDSCLGDRVEAGPLASFVSQDRDQRRRRRRRRDAVVSGVKGKGGMDSRATADTTGVIIGVLERSEEDGTSYDMDEDFADEGDDEVGGDGESDGGSGVDPRHCRLKWATPLLSAREQRGQSLRTRLLLGAARGAQRLARALCLVRSVAPRSLTPARLRAQRELARSGSARGCVLICGPNAGVYEYSWRFAEWAERYGQLGFDVCLFNYRGYGRSAARYEAQLLGGWLGNLAFTDASPRPAALRRDAEAVAMYLLQEASARALVVHGESLGGIAACHLGSLGLADFLVADRTFDTLTTAGRHMVGAWSESALVLLTRWTRSNAAAFIASPPPPAPGDDAAATEASQVVVVLATQANETTEGVGAILPLPPLLTPLPLRKLIAQDAQDAVIHWEAGLQQGVAALAGDAASPALCAELDACAAHLYLLLLRACRVTAPMFAGAAATEAAAAIAAEDDNDAAAGRLSVRARVAAAVESTRAGDAHSSSSTVRALAAVVARDGLSVPPACLAFEEAVALCYGGASAGLDSVVITAVAQSAALSCAHNERQLQAAHGGSERFGGPAPSRILVGPDSAASPRGKDGVDGPGLAGASAVSERLLRLVIDADTETFGATAAEAYGAGALVLIIAGLSNGCGQRLGDVAAADLGARGVRAVRAFLSAGLLWGFEMQEGTGALADLRAAAASCAAVSGLRHTSPTPAERHTFPTAAEPVTAAPAAAAETPFAGGAAAWAMSGRTAAYLQAAREAGLTTALRRLRLLAAPLSAASATRPVARDQPRRAPGAPPVDPTFVAEALALLERLDALRSLWRREFSGSSGFGQCLPLACGHNMPWAEADMATLEAALAAAGL